MSDETVEEEILHYRKILTRSLSAVEPGGEDVPALVGLLLASELCLLRMELEAIREAIEEGNVKEQ